MQPCHHTNCSTTRLHCSQVDVALRNTMTWLTILTHEHKHPHLSVTGITYRHTHSSPFLNANLQQVLVWTEEKCPVFSHPIHDIHNWIKCQTRTSSEVWAVKNTITCSYTTLIRVGHFWSYQVACLLVQYLRVSIPVHHKNVRFLFIIMRASLFNGKNGEVKPSKIEHFEVLSQCRTSV